MSLLCFVGFSGFALGSVAALRIQSIDDTKVAAQRLLINNKRL